MSDEGVEQVKCSLQTENSVKCEFADGSKVSVSVDWSLGGKLLGLTFDGEEEIFQMFSRNGSETTLQFLGAKHNLKVFNNREYPLQQHMIEIPPPDYSKMQ